MGSILDRWEDDLARTREREGAEFRNPCRRRRTPPPDPRLAPALETALASGFLPPALSRSAPACREWARRCEERGLPDVRIQQQPPIKTFTIVVSLRPLPESPTASVIEQVVERLRRASMGKTSVAASAAVIVASRIPPEDVCELAVWCARVLRPAAVPPPAGDNTD